MESIDRLQTIEAGQKLQDIWYLCFDAQQNVDNIFNQSVYGSHLKISREPAALLKEALDGKDSPVSDPNREITIPEVWTIQHSGNRFKEVLMAELNVLPIFLVTEKEGYDINTIVENGHKLFPPSILTKCPEANIDMLEAGKALAFELSTACGFHVFRVTEAVLKRYWDHVSDGADRPKLETIGSYAKALEEQEFGHTKIAEALKQLASLHRNPLIHPEVILTVEEAIETLGIARSVVGAMLRVMPDVPPTTAPNMAS